MTGANAQGTVSATWLRNEPRARGLRSAATSSRHDFALHATWATYWTVNPRRVFAGPSVGRRDLALSVQ